MVQGEAMFPGQQGFIDAFGLFAPLVSRALNGYGKNRTVAHTLQTMKIKNFRMDAPPQVKEKNEQKKTIDLLL